MSYRFLVVTAGSPAFLSQFYQQQPQTSSFAYQEQLDALLFESFGWSDAYALNLRRLGHEAETLVVNAPGLQARWAAEHGRAATARQMRLLTRLEGQRELGGRGLGDAALGTLRTQQRRLLHEVFLAQVKDYRPDVILVQLRTPITAAVLRAARAYCRLIVGQIASRFPAYTDLFGVYDLLISSFPHYVRFFNDCGLRSAYLPLAFEPVFLERCHRRYGDARERTWPAVFVGSVSDQHRERVRWLETLAARKDVTIWLSHDVGWRSLNYSDQLRQVSRPPVHGLEMYDVYRRARIGLNAHAELSGPYANIMRMYEITGAGSMLLTEDRRNLPELFEPGKEVVTYTGIDDCLAKLDYYLAHEDERAAVAEAGRRRTYAEHLYVHRAQTIAEWLRTLVRL